MPQLLDLPEELLTLILEEVGGRELRRNRNNLLISRGWYASARSVYLSGIELSQVREHGCTLAARDETFWHSANERRLMQKNTRTLHLRLRGHWWDEGTRAHYAQRNVDEDGDETQVEANVSPRDTPIVAPEHDEQLLAWRDTCNAQLASLAPDLANFETLEDLMLQVGFDSREAFGPPWAYVYASTLETLLPSLPLISSLNILTLDLYADLIDDTPAGSGVEVEGESLCSSCLRIAAVIPFVPKVRLRLKKSCAAVFSIPNDLSAEQVRLSSLLVKLHMPHHNYGRIGDPATMPAWCHGGEEEMQSERHYHSMVTAARNMLEALTLTRARANNTSSMSTKPVQPSSSSSKPTTKRERKKASKHPSSSQQPHPSGLEHLRISWPGPQGSINIYVADVLRNRTMAPGEEFFVYEDEGYDCWDLEERVDLRDTWSLEDGLLL